MKKVILKSLSMRNFRGEKERTTNFNNVETFIIGDNGTGKSRHFDAFVWLLFGKDTKERKDYNIKTLVNGKILDKIDVEVSGVLNVDGEIIRLRRVYTEKWVKPRGKVEERFDGHEHELYWNDVPLKVGEYQARINSIINDSVFKMITNPLFFANMKWQEQRDVLFQLAGTISDQEIAAQNPEYAVLLNRISGKSLADFKREISARKRKLKEEFETIQPRIDQTHKLMPESTDFDALEFEIESLENQIKNVDEAIADKTKAIRQQYEGVQAKQSEINELKQRRQQVLFDAQTKSREDTFKANANFNELENNIKAIEKEIITMERSCQLSERELESSKKRLETKNKDIEDLRKSWFEENSKEYQGEDTCHTCGQMLPEAQRSEARDLFAKSKQNKLAEITRKGGDISNEVSELKQDIENTQKTLETQKNGIEIKSEQLAKFREQISNMQIIEASDVKTENIKEYVELSKQIELLEAELNTETEQIDTIELQNRKKDIVKKLDFAKIELQKRDLITKYQDEIKDLKAKGQQIAQQIADTEREEYIIQNFTRTKIDESEKRINGMFTMVTFKLFDYTIEGNEIETCIPLVDGVPFGTANTAGQLNAGLDIINTLVKFHGVSAPIFIDGRESVNNIIQIESQIINLVVLPKTYECKSCGNQQSTNNICRCGSVEFSDITPKELIIK